MLIAMSQKRCWMALGFRQVKCMHDRKLSCMLFARRNHSLVTGIRCKYHPLFHHYRLLQSLRGRNWDSKINCWISHEISECDGLEFHISSTAGDMTSEIMLSNIMTKNSHTNQGDAEGCRIFVRPEFVCSFPNSHKTPCPSSQLYAGPITATLYFNHD